MKLNEIKQLQESEFITNREEILRWTGSMGLTQFKIQPDGSVNFHNDAQFSGMAIAKLPFRIGKVGRDFNISRSSLTTMEGFPKEVGGSVEASWNRITSFVGCSEKIGGDLDLSHNPIKSLVGIADHLKECHGTLYIAWEDIKEGGLGLLHVEGLQIARWTFGTEPGWLRIITKYLGKPDDVFECQAELIEKGYEEYAKL